LAMLRAFGLIELVLEFLDLLAQLVAIVAIAIPGPVGALVLAAQAVNLLPLPRDLALLEFELGDQLLTSRGMPTRLQTSVMPDSPISYKYNLGVSASLWWA
jgi:hypothetical protein